MSKNNVEKLQKQNIDLRIKLKKLQTNLQQVKDNLDTATTDNQEIEKKVELSYRYRFYRF